MPAAIDLNSLKLPDECQGQDPTDNTTTSRDGSVTVYFRDLEQQLIRRIAGAEAVVGCIAWLTSESILRALAVLPAGASIVVQKEDFLRPDAGSKPGWATKLRSLYGRVPSIPERHAHSGLVSKLSVCSDPAIDPVRCVGNHNRNKAPAFPRMHNKFLVFCKVFKVAEQNYGRPMMKPYAVWTGSFNLTKNASMSLENAVVLTDPAIVSAYFNEWGQVLALSESLDWESDWSEPEWRIGS
jgi:hypothetical protein